MTTIGWIILAILLIPALGLLVWVVLSASFVRVPAGRNALLLVAGRPTDTTLPPGLHFVFALRRRMVVTYPSVELGSAPAVRTTGQGERTRLRGRAGADHPGGSGAGHGGLHRAVPAASRRLRLVHERFGPEGIFGIVRDESALVISTALGRTGPASPTSSESPAGDQSRQRLTDSLGTALADGRARARVLRARRDRPRSHG